MRRSQEADKPLSCSFCGKLQTIVATLIAGPVVYICNECVDLCNHVIEDTLKESDVRTRPPFRPVTHVGIISDTNGPSMFCPICQTEKSASEFVFAAPDNWSGNYDPLLENDSYARRVRSAEDVKKSARLCRTCVTAILSVQRETPMCVFCRTERDAHEFPMIEVDMCVRCAQTGMWLLTHETLTATGKTLLAMRELLDRGHEALFDRIVTATRDGHLHCTSFDGAPLSILRDVGLITPENAEITLEASSVIKEYCRSNGVTFSVEVPGYPDRNLTKTAGQPS